MASKNNKRNTTIFMFILLACLGLSSIIINATNKSGKIYGLNQPDGVVLTTQVGYSTPPEHGLIIENTGTGELQVTGAVTVDNEEAFEIVVKGASLPSIQPGEGVSDSFYVKAKSGLGAGVYEGIITALTDASENEGKLTTTVKLTVTGSVSGASVSMANWSYGDSPSEPVLSGGLENLSTSDYEITYSKDDIDTWNTQKPTTPGGYRVKVHITNPAYTADDATANFTINNATKELRIEANTSSHEYDGNAYSDSGYKVYFDNSEVSNGQLPTGDTISNVRITGSVTYVSDNPTGGNKNNIIDRGSLTIENMGYYENINYVDGVIKIIPRTQPIIITPKGGEKDFDGQRFTDIKWSADGMDIAGHKLDVTLKITQGDTVVYECKGAGSYNVEVDTVTVKNTTGLDVTNCFNIQEKIGTIKINPVEQKISLTGLRVDAAEDTIFVQKGTTLSSKDMKSKFSGIYENSTIKFYLVSDSNSTQTTATQTTALNSEDGDAVVTPVGPTVTVGMSKIGGIEDNGKFIATACGTAEFKIVVSATDVVGIEDTEDKVGKKDGVADYKETVKKFKIEVTEKKPLSLIEGITNNQVFTYDGQPKKPLVNGGGTLTLIDGIPADSLVITYSGTGSTIYNDTNPPTKPGTYKAVYSVPDSNTEYEGRRTYFFTINKVKLAKPSYGNEENLNKTYTGSAITLDVTGFDENYMNMQGTTSATTANDYQVKYSLKDTENYSWDDDTTDEVVINWKILKAIPAYTLPTDLSGAKGNALSTIDIPAGWTWKTPDTIMNDVGNQEFEIIFTPEDTNNYETVEKTVTVNVRDIKFINKVELEYDTSKTPLTPGMTYNEWVKRFLSTCLPIENSGKGYRLNNESTVITTLNYWDGTKWVPTLHESDQYIKDSRRYAIQTNVYTESGYDFEKNSEKYKNVEVWINGVKKDDAEITNYSEEGGYITLYIPVEISYPEKPELNVNDSYVYNGKSQTASVEGFDSATMDISGNTQKNAGDYVISVTPKSKWSDGTNDTVTVDWNIQKAQPTYDSPGKLNGVEGTTLGEVKLPEGFSWEDPDIVLVKGTDKYSAVFTPNDTDNYETISGIYIEVETKSAEEIVNELGLKNSEDYGDFSFLRTGDTTNIMYLISTMAVSAPGAIALIKRRKNKNNR